MTSSFVRIGTANAYENSVRNLAARHGALVNLNAQMSANKSVTRGSDDPLAASQAERATNRLSLIGSEQRVLEAQKTTVTSGMTSLGDATSALQDFRDLVVGAGTGTQTSTDRANIVQQLTSLRDRILSYANQRDTNGQALFGGLGSISTPFSDSGGTVTYNGIAGQTASSGNTIASALDGYAAFMNVASGNGVFAVTLPTDSAGAVTNTGSAWADAGTVTDPSAVTGSTYTLTFAVDSAGATTYSVPGSSPAISGQAYTAGQTIAFDGLSFVVKGTPADGDTMTIAPSEKVSLFTVLDAAITGIGKAGTNTGSLMQAVTQSLAQVDTGMNRVLEVQGYAGELLNRAGRINDIQDARKVQVTSDLSTAEGSDEASQVKRISDFSSQQTGYSAALASYAQVQKLSLFNYIS